MRPSKSAAASKPFFKSFLAEKEKDDQSGHLHRLVIGLMGAFLPLLVWLTFAWWPLEKFPRWAALSSISAYYYTGAVAVFAGVLASLAVYFFTYEGYKNEWAKWEKGLSLFAGAAALCVAFFPTKPPKEIPQLFWWREWMGTFHFSSAVALFTAFAVFALVLFRKSKPGTKVLPLGKKWRNFLYTVSGLGIVASLLWAGWNHIHEASIFLPEACALEFFALSWLVKGRADSPLVKTLIKAKYYGLAPVRGAGKAWRNFQSQ